MDNTLSITNNPLLKNSTKNIPILSGSVDLYNGIHIKSKEHTDITEQETARSSLIQSLENWKKDMESVWFEDSWWISILHEEGFSIHHANNDYIMMTKWFLDSANTLPKYPFVYVGAGGIVINEKNEILLMRERRGPYLGWKFPGGMVDPNEELHAAAIREVFEETGVKTKFVNLIGFRHLTQYNYPTTDNIYFMFVLKPVDENDITVSPCEEETGDCKWMSREEISNLSEELIRPWAKGVLDKLDQQLELKRGGAYFDKGIYTFN